MSNKNRKKGSSLKKVKSRELRSSMLYRDCDCYRRNGLQHDCPRTECDDTQCEAIPWPECDLACHFINKWHNLYYKKQNETSPIPLCKTNRKEGSKKLKIVKTETIYKSSEGKRRPLRGRYMLSVEEEIE